MMMNLLIMMIFFENKCIIKTCDKDTGIIIETKRGCSIENDFPQYSEKSRECYECYCRPIDGKLILILKSSEYYDNGTIKNNYTINKCGYCVINGIVNEKDSYGNEKDCVYHISVDKASINTTSTVISISIVFVIISIIIILIGAKETYDLVMLSKSISLGDSKINGIYESKDDGGENIVFKGNEN